MYVFKKIFGFLRLYRFDVFIIFFFLYFLGCYIATGFEFNLSDSLLVSLLISGISINFIYSLNSWFDADIDKINKPKRPIPSGLISKSQAFIYALVLLCLSTVYPVILFGFSTTAAWFLFFPLAGILYSNPVFSFKKNKFFALLLITAYALVTCSLGYFLNGGTLTFISFIYGCVLIITCAAIIPLKDLSDVEGDAAGNAGNWFENGRQQERFTFSAGFFTLSAVLSFFLDDALVSAVTLINLFCFVILLWSFHRFGITLKKFYRTLLLVFVFDALLFWACYFFVYGRFLV